MTTRESRHANFVYGKTMPRGGARQGLRGGLADFMIRNLASALIVAMGPGGSMTCVKIPLSAQAFRPLRPMKACSGELTAARMRTRQSDIRCDTRALPRTAICCRFRLIHLQVASSGSMRKIAETIAELILASAIGIFFHLAASLHLVVFWQRNQARGAGGLALRRAKQVPKTPQVCVTSCPGGRRNALPLGAEPARLQAALCKSFAGPLLATT